MPGLWGKPEPIVLEFESLGLEEPVLWEFTWKDKFTNHLVVKEIPEMEDKKTSFTGYYIAPEARMVFTALKKISDRNPKRAVKLMMVGPTGFGKTTLPELFAKAIDYDFYRMNCASIRDPEEWFGYREAKDGSTLFVESQLIKLLGKGRVVIVLDEFNRVEPWLHNTLYPLLDDGGKTVIHDQEFVVGENVIVVGTINLGYKYTGIFELDEALLRRFNLVYEVTPMPEVEERKVLVQRTGLDADVAKKLVRMANILRQSQIPCSTGTTLDIAYAIQAGMMPRDAFENVVVKRLAGESTSSNSQKKQALDLLNVEYHHYKPSAPDDDVFGDDGSEKVVEFEPGEGYCVTLKHKKGETLGVGVKVMKLLRSLPTPKEMGVQEAKQIFEWIEEEKLVVIPLAGKPENVKELAQQLSDLGLSGRFQKSDTTEVKVIE